MALDHHAIRKIAHMARIHIADHDIAHYEDLNDILDLAAQMNAVDTSNVEPLSHPLDIKQRMREDQITESNIRDTLLPLAPLSEAGVYLVPKVIE